VDKMGIYHDEDSKVNDMLRDISHRHCPDSVRESAYIELNKRGISHKKAQEMADENYGDYWG
jgi:hypothetical protein